MSETTPDDPRAAALEGLERFHAAVDRAAAALAERHAERLACRRGCASCCVDGITVFEVEAERIRSRHAAWLETAAPHAEGACAFLDDDGACRVYDDRPYVCRTQGLPLRWLEETPEGRLVDLRDICPLNADGAPLAALDERECWTCGPAERRLAEVQRRYGGVLARVALRDLFGRPASAGRLEGVPVRERRRPEGMEDRR